MRIKILRQQLCGCGGGDDDNAGGGGGGGGGCN